MKVRNDDPSRLSSTERTVVNWLKSWSGPHAVPGIAVVQCQDADVVVWTPQTCVVIAVHGFTERVNGTLHCAEDEPWTVDENPAPVDGDGNPLERVRRQTTELARQLRAAPGREHVPVSGLVLLVPQLGSRLKLTKGAMPPGIDVLLGDGPSSLRAYFTGLADGADPAWDAAQVGQALGALGFAAAATHSDLVLEGFDPPAANRTPPPPNSVPARSVPSVPVAAPEPPEPPHGEGTTTGVVPGPAAVPVRNPVPGTAAGGQQPAPGTTPGRQQPVPGTTPGGQHPIPGTASSGQQGSRQDSGTVGMPGGRPGPHGASSATGMAPEGRGGAQRESGSAGDAPDSERGRGHAPGAAGTTPADHGDPRRESGTAREAAE
ncbi:NERD domain-containing protein, partial [Nocardia sp. CC201C]